MSDMVSSFVAFDIETTGFLAGMDQITEIAAVKFEKGHPTSTYTTLINPKREIPIKVEQITGITDEMVKDKPTIDEVLDDFAEFCGQDILVAHNAPFDFEFLTSDIKKFESKAPRGLVFDSCAMARNVFPGLLNYKLGTLVNYLNIPSSEGFHRAKEDACCCGYLMVHVCEKLEKDRSHKSFLEKFQQVNNSKPLQFVQIVKRPKQMEMFNISTYRTH